MDNSTGPLFATGLSGSQATRMLTGGGRRYFLLNTSAGSPGRIIGTALISLHPPAAGCPVTATPNPIIACGNGQDPVGSATIKWSVPNATSTQVRINSADGQVFATGGAGGTQTTGKWVTNGTKFYVLDTSNNQQEPIVKGLTTVTVTNAGCGDGGTGDFTNRQRKAKR